MGPDKCADGNYLVLPPDYEGDILKGYFVVKSPTNRVWTFIHGSTANGMEAVVKNITENLKVYPLTEEDNPSKMEFVRGPGKPLNTI